jgi:hypothetical protein
MSNSSENRLEFRLQAERSGYGVIPPEGGTPNDFIVSGRRHATLSLPGKRCWMPNANRKNGLTCILLVYQSYLFLGVVDVVTDDAQKQ